MSLMRVVHLVTRSHRRGAEVVALELAAALDALGHDNEVHALALGADGSVVDGLPVLVPSAGVGLPTLARSAWRVRRMLARHPVDIVLAHGGSAAFVVALAAPASGGARVWQRILGLPLEGWGPLRRTVWRRMVRRFDGVAALTSDLEAEVRQLGFSGPVRVIPNARDPERFAHVDRASAAAVLRSQVGVDASVPIVAFVGHLVEQKDPELAVDVAAELVRLGQPVHLVMAGDGPMRSAVEKRIAARGMARSVTMLGHRDDPELVFAGAALALLTSRAEGIPGVAIEAQMCGCPLVSVPVGGVGDVVEDAVTGVIVPSRDAILVATSVARLLGDPTRLRAMGAAAAQRARVFTMASVAPLYVALFDEVTAAKRQR